LPSFFGNCHKKIKTLFDYKSFRRKKSRKTHLKD